MSASWFDDRSRQLMTPETSGACRGAVEFSPNRGSLRLVGQSGGYRSAGVGAVVMRLMLIVACAFVGVSTTACVDAVDANQGFEFLVRQFSSAWQHADAHAIAELFAPDATLVVPDGRLVNGRSAIEAFYHAAFSSGYAGSRVDSKIEYTYRFRRDIAIVDGEWHIGGIRGEADHTDERGVLSAIMMRIGTRWSIAALREQAGATAIRRIGP